MKQARAVTVYFVSADMAAMLARRRCGAVQCGRVAHVVPAHLEAAEQLGEASQLDAHAAALWRRRLGDRGHLEWSHLPQAPGRVRSHTLKALLKTSWAVVLILLCFRDSLHALL